MEKNVWSVKMGISAVKGGVQHLITVEFDLSDLTPQQIAQWAVSANGIRVWYQNRERPKGEAHLIELSKSTQYVKVPPCGTRTGRAPTPDEAIELLVRSGKVNLEMLEMMVDTGAMTDAQFDKYSAMIAETKE